MASYFWQCAPLGSLYTTSLEVYIHGLPLFQPASLKRCQSDPSKIHAAAIAANMQIAVASKVALEQADSNLAPRPTNQPSSNLWAVTMMQQRVKCSFIEISFFTNDDPYRHKTSPSVVHRRHASACKFCRGNSRHFRGDSKYSIRFIQ